MKHVLQRESFVNATFGGILLVLVDQKYVVLSSDGGSSWYIFYFHNWQNRQSVQIK